MCVLESLNCLQCDIVMEEGDSGDVIPAAIGGEEDHQIDSGLSMVCDVISSYSMYMEGIQ